MKRYWIGRIALSLLVIAAISAFTGIMFYGITYKNKVGYLEIQSRQIGILNDQIQVVVDDVIENIEDEPRWRLSYQWEDKYKKEAFQTFADSRVLFNDYKDSVRCTVDEKYSDGIRTTIETYPFVWRENTSKYIIEYSFDYELKEQKPMLLRQDQYFRMAMETIKQNAVIVAFVTAIVLTVIDVAIMIRRKKKA